MDLGVIYNALAYERWGATLVFALAFEGGSAP